MGECAMVRFSEMASQVKTKVKPADTDLDRYVGLEHLDPESLHIRRWGVPGDVTGEKIVVRKGDIIFGKRRAYQRKVAIADFDCICSAHAMVLQPKEDVIIRELFPFFLQSDLFMNRAVQISVGGLSPTINWKDLARQEFPLPPIEEQRRIAEVLWAAEDVIVKDEALLAEAEHYKQVMMRELFSKGIGHEEFREVEKVGVVPKGWEVRTVMDLCEQIIDCPHSTPQFKNEGILVIRNYNIKNGMLDLTNPSYTTEEEYYTRIQRGPPSEGDIIFSREAPMGEACLVPANQKLSLGQRMVLLKPGLDKINNYFFVQSFYSVNVKKQMIATSIGQTVERLNVSDIKKVRIPTPPLPEQRQIASILSAIDDNIAAARGSVEASKALKMRLISQLLSPDGETA